MGLVRTVDRLRSSGDRFPCQEDEWSGSVLSFGKGDDALAINVTMRDLRCSRKREVVGSSIGLDAHLVSA